MGAPGPFRCPKLFSPPMTPLAEWQTFYQIVGSAAAALTGLQFVAIALVADVPMKSGEHGVEAFTGPTIVHFVAALLLAASVVMPWNGLAPPAICWSIAGLSGLVYVACVVHRMRKQTAYQPVFEDWLFHAILPFCAYAGLAASGLRTRLHPRGALFGIAAVSLLLLVVGIHNSWDNLTYLVVMKRRHMKEAAKHNATAESGSTTS